MEILEQELNGQGDGQINYTEIQLLVILIIIVIGNSVGLVQ